MRKRLGPDQTGVWLVVFAGFISASMVSGLDTSSTSMVFLFLSSFLASKQKSFMVLASYFTPAFILHPLLNLLHRPRIRFLISCRFFILFLPSIAFGSALLWFGLLIRSVMLVFAFGLLAAGFGSFQLTLLALLQALLCGVHLHFCPAFSFGLLHFSITHNSNPPITSVTLIRCRLNLLQRRIDLLSCISGFGFINPMRELWLGLGWFSWLFGCTHVAFIWAFSYFVHCKQVLNVGVGWNWLDCWWTDCSTFHFGSSLALRSL